MAQKKTLFKKPAPQAAAYLRGVSDCFPNNSRRRYENGTVVWFIWLQLKLRCQARGRLAYMVNKAKKRALLSFVDESGPGFRLSPERRSPGERLFAGQETVGIPTS